MKEDKLLADKVRSALKKIGEFNSASFEIIHAFDALQKEVRKLRDRYPFSDLKNTRGHQRKLKREYDRRGKRIHDMAGQLCHLRSRCAKLEGENKRLRGHDIAGQLNQLKFRCANLESENKELKAAQGEKHSPTDSPDAFRAFLEESAKTVREKWTPEERAQMDAYFGNGHR